MKLMKEHRHPLLGTLREEDFSGVAIWAHVTHVSPDAFPREGCANCGFSDDFVNGQYNVGPFRLCLICAYRASREVAHEAP